MINQHMRMTVWLVLCPFH